MNNPEYVKVGEKKYRINTDFRIAIECDNIARDDNIDDYERALAIIYKLFGDEGINNHDDYKMLLKMAIKYLTCNNNQSKNKNEKIDMDFEEDKHYIRSSFIQDYHYNPYDMEYLHYWDFFHDLDGLSNSEFGNCCVLNRIRNYRNIDPNTIKDNKERQKVIEIQEKIALKKYKKENNLTKKQQESIMRLNELLK